MKAALFLTLACFWFIQGCTRTPDLAAVGKKELEGVLKCYLKPEVQSEDYQEGDGWFQPTNRQALASFIARHAETEEAYQAETWLTLGLPFDGNRVNAAQRLQVISQKTSRSGTEKFASLQRAFVLYEENGNDHAEFEKQALEILSHIQDYESENDKQFSRYLEVTNMRRSDIEPTLRLLFVSKEAYAGRTDRALELARDLKKKFPRWDTRSVDAQIEMLELYKRGWRLGKN